jgi:hypothetical protein
MKEFRCSFFIQILFIIILIICCVDKRRLNSGSKEFPLDGLSVENSEIISIDTLVDHSPWIQGDVMGWHRPLKAFKALFLNSMEDSVLCFLAEFPDEYLAFGLFKKYASFPVSRKNYFFSKNIAVFLNLKFVGTLVLPEGNNWNNQKIEEFLPLIGSEFNLPKIYDSFPIKGRIPNSESVTAHHLLGQDFLGEAVSVNFACYNDTAIVFRTFFNPNQKSFHLLVKNYAGRIGTLEKGYLSFWGVTDFGNAIFLIGHDDGLIGCEGCSDQGLSMQFARKTLEMNSLLP